MSLQEHVNIAYAAGVALALGPEAKPAQYIPELAHVPGSLVAVAVAPVSGAVLTAGDAEHRFTMQSSTKLLLLGGLLAERGHDVVFARVGKEPSPSAFSALAPLETHGPRPANPLINAGAIALAGLLEGHLEDKLAWIEQWSERLYGRALPVNARVLASERRTGDRNRAIAYLLRANGVLAADVDETLEVYFALCSLEGTVADAARLGCVLAQDGVAPQGQRVLPEATSRDVVAVMATCGMYDESGAHLLEVGLPAKSGVSGVIVAVAPSEAGIAVYSPCINGKGASLRGRVMLEHLAKGAGWHFAARHAPARR